MPGVPPSVRSLPITVSQSAVSSAGRSASLTTRCRQRPERSTRPEAGHVTTAPLSTPARSRRRLSAPCGCCTSTLAQAVSARFWSSPGSTTQPCGAAAMAINRSRVAGAVPVEPAATITPCGGASVHCSASRRSSRTRRALTSITPSAASRCGQSASAASRNRRETCQCSAISASTRSASPASTVTSSICRPSRNPARASAISSAAAAVSSRPDNRSQWLAARRVSSNRRFSGSIAAGRSSARSPGSKGGSPPSRSPSGRIRGGSMARPPATCTKASARARAPRRVGVSTRACDNASGPCGANTS